MLAGALAAAAVLAGLAVLVVNVVVVGLAVDRNAGVAVHLAMEAAADVQVAQNALLLHVRAVEAVLLAAAVVLVLALVLVPVLAVAVAAAVGKNYTKFKHASFYQTE